MIKRLCLAVASVLCAAVCSPLIDNILSRGRFVSVEKLMNGEIVPTTTNQFVSGLYSPIPRTALVAIVLIVTIAIARSTMPKGLMVIIGFMIGLLCAPFISNLYWYNGCGLWSDFHTPAAVTTLTMLGLVCMGTIAVAISAKPSQSKEV